METNTPAPPVPGPLTLEEAAAELAVLTLAAEAARKQAEEGALLIFKATGRFAHISGCLARLCASSVPGEHTTRQTVRIPDIERLSDIVVSVCSEDAARLRELTGA